MRNCRPFFRSFLICCPHLGAAKERTKEWTAIIRFILSVLLPFHLIAKDLSICGIFGGERGGALLYAKHQQGGGAVVANGTLALGGYSDHTAFFNGEYLSVYLEFTFSAEEEV